MRHIWTLIIFLFLPLILLAGDAAGADEISYTVKPSVWQEGDLYFLAAEGATNLPDKSVLDITFTYRFPGGDNDRYLDYKRCLVSGGIYQVRLGPFRSKPPAGQYLFRVAFDPDRQSDVVRKYLEGKYRSREALALTESLTVGKSIEEAAQERQRMLSIIKKEGLTLKAIFDDIKAHVPEYSRTADIKSLRRWSAATTAQLEALVRGILLEDELRVFEMVTQAKASIENSAFLLKSFLQKQESILALREQPPVDTDEFNRKLALLDEDIAGLYKLTDKEVTKNLKELGIFSLDKQVLLGLLKKIEGTITRAPENESLKEVDKSAMMEQIVALSRNLPDIFYDQLHQLVAEVVSAIKGNQPMTKQVKEVILNRIKTFRSEIEGK